LAGQRCDEAIRAEHLQAGRLGKSCDEEKGYKNSTKGGKADCSFFERKQKISVCSTQPTIKPWPMLEPSPPRLISDTFDMNYVRFSNPER
jgi:hypothetical protein